MQFGLLETVFVIPLPGLPAKCPAALGAAREVQLRILITAAFIPRISSGLGWPRSAPPAPPAASSVGSGEWGPGTLALQTQTAVEQH